MRFTDAPVSIIILSCFPSISTRQVGGWLYHCLLTVYTYSYSSSISSDGVTVFTSFDFGGLVQQTRAKWPVFSHALQALPLTGQTVLWGYCPPQFRHVFGSPYRWRCWIFFLFEWACCRWKFDLSSRDEWICLPWPRLLLFSWFELIVDSVFSNCLAWVSLICNALPIFNRSIRL